MFFAAIAALAWAAPVPADLHDAAALGPVRAIVSLRATDPHRSLGLAALQDRVLHDAGVTLEHRLLRAPGLIVQVDAETLARLAAHPEVHALSLDQPAHAIMEESVPLVRGDAVRNTGVTGAGVKVAVLDTGVDTTHPDLTGRVVDEYCFCTDNCCPDGTDEQTGTGAARDEADHGTPASGIIASRGTVSATGFVPEADLVAVRVLDETGAGTVGAVLAGLDWIAAHHPDTDVVNVSIAGATRYDSACDTESSVGELAFDAVEALRANGALVLAGSGNNGDLAAMGMPACLTNVISVGATYDDDLNDVAWSSCTDASPKADQVACITNGGPLLDLLAPGYGITAPSIGGDTRRVGGTSYAVPHATGVAAQLRDLEPSLTPDELTERLLSTGVPVVDDRTGLTHPRVDAWAAAALPTVETACDDDFDDDGDGDIDCDDSDCEADCPGLFACGCTTGAVPQPALLLLAVVALVRRRRSV